MLIQKDRTTPDFRGLPYYHDKPHFNQAINSPLFNADFTVTYMEPARLKVNELDVYAYV